MKKLILLGGDLASGKSTYSALLAEKFNLLVINKDNLKEILGDNIPVTTREENKRLSSASFDLMCYLLVKNKTADLVLESNFKPAEMARLATLCPAQGYDVLSLVFRGDDAILHARFLSRLQEHRHYVHKSQDFSELAPFVSALTELRSVSYIGEVIPVDASTFAYQQDPLLFERIGAFLAR